MMNYKYVYTLVAIGLMLLSHSALSDTQSCPDYNRSDWGYRVTLSPYHDDKVGFYTNTRTSATDVDHIVSLHDAHASGGCFWSVEEKQQFANDSENQVPSEPYINRIVKKHHAPKKFIEKMQEKDKEFYDDMRKCVYVARYRDIKAKYNLRITEEDSVFIIDVLKTCPIGRHALRQ